MKPLRILCVVPVTNDPTSLYRGVGPLSALQENCNVQYLFTSNQVADWDQIKMVDLVFMQRPATQGHLQILYRAKDLGKPVIIDFDDNNMNVPKSNPRYHEYNRADIQDAIVKLARHADMVWVTTKFLQKRYSIYSKAVYHVPNAVDDKFLHFRNIPNVPRQKIMLWRGMGGQEVNINTISKEVVDLAKKNPDWVFAFWGVEPLSITDHIRNYKWIPEHNPIDYYKQIVNLHVQALYYALADNEHSQARSHVCWLESTFAASLSILPKHDEFIRPGTLNFSTPAEFQSIAESVMKGEVDVDKHVAESWECIQDKYLLSHVNKTRQELIEMLVGRKIGLE